MHIVSISLHSKSNGEVEMHVLTTAGIEKMLYRSWESAQKDRDEIAKNLNEFLQGMAGYSND